MADKIKCNLCGRIINSEDAFCDYCGAEQGNVEESGTSDVGCGSELAKTSVLPVKVLWNTARKFVEETTLSFNMRLLSECDVSDVEVAVVSDVEDIGQLSKSVGVCAASKENRIDLPFKAPAGSAGEIPFDIYLRYIVGDETHVLHGRRTHSVYREEQPPREVHIHTNIKTGDGHAVDHNVNVNNAGAANVVARDKKALWEDINKADEWVELELEVVDEFQEGDVAAIKQSATRLRAASGASVVALRAMPDKTSWQAEAQGDCHTGGETTESTKTSKKNSFVAAGVVLIGVVVVSAYVYMGRNKPAVVDPAQNPIETPQPSETKEVPKTAINSQEEVVEAAAGKGVVAKNTSELKEKKPPFNQEPVENVAKAAVNASAGETADDFSVNLELAGGLTEFVEGDKLQYRIKSEKSCYVALLCYQVDGSTVVLFPNLWNSDCYIQAGRGYLIPDAGSGFEIEVSPPFGKDRVELIACTHRSELHRMLGEYATVTTRGMPFSVVKREKVDDAVTRGMKVVAKDGEGKPAWFRKSIVVVTKKGVEK